MDSLGNILKIIYLGFEKSQRSVTYDFLRYINILTYLLTYVLIMPDFLPFSLHVEVANGRCFSCSLLLVNDVLLQFVARFKKPLF